MSSLYLVIPVFNEADNLPRLLQQVEAWERSIRQSSATRALEVILVDDGSHDGSAEVARAHAGNVRVRVLTHRANLGPGAAFGTAFAFLHGKVADDDLVLTLEGDNTSNTDVATRMLVRIKEGYDVVLASPYAYGGRFTKTSSWRLILSYLGTEFTRAFIGIQGIHTTSSFFRLYRGHCINRLFEHFGPRIIERPGFECMIELLYKLVLIGSSISEVEMLVDSSRRMGPSKMRITRTVLGYLSVASLTSSWRRQIEHSKAFRAEPAEERGLRRSA